MTYKSSMELGLKGVSNFRERLVLVLGGDGPSRGLMGRRRNEIWNEEVEVLRVTWREVGCGLGIGFGSIGGGTGIEYN
jgi:hypothetical protein